MTLAIVATIGGLTLLAWSADKFVMGAAHVARLLGLGPLLVGVVVIGFGTSAPELFVSTVSAVQGSPELALGNAFGSNIANIGLVLGVTALVLPIAVTRGILRKELPLLIVVTAVVWLLMLDGTLSRADALVLLVALLLLVRWLIVQARSHGSDDLAVQTDQAVTSQALSKRAAWFWTVAGLVLIVVAAWLLVWGATRIATALGWSELVIGLTVVAIGTSTPELATSIAALRRGENELALGNIIGSSFFNSLGVVGVAALVMPATVSPELIYRDLPVVMLLTVLLVAFGYRWRSDGRINRFEGGVLVLLWAAYTAYLLVTAS